MVDQAKAALKAEKALQRQSDKALKKQTKSVQVSYQVGLEDLALSGQYTLTSATEGLKLENLLMRKSKAKTITIPWSNLVGVEAGTESELQSRVTVSRILLTGIFAFGMKKEKRQDFYVSIETKDSVGLFSLLNLNSSNSVSSSKTKVFAAACNSKIRTANSMDKAQVERPPSDLGEIEKLGDLLSKGLINQKEFEKKKKRILGI